MSISYRQAWAEIDLGRVRHNASLLSRIVAPARLCAVVKADGYGHGATAVAKAAIEGGAGLIGVALAEEAIALREAGVASPILMLTEAPASAMEPLVDAGVTITLYRPHAVVAAANAARRLDRVVPVHVKVDTGMHRVGADPEDVVALCRQVQVAGLRLEGLWTHFAVADDPEDPFTNEQLSRFERVVAAARRSGFDPPLLHAANSAGAIAHPTSRYDFVRCGIASYGYAPSERVAAILRREVERVGASDSLVPVLKLVARVHLVRDLEAGERVSYGRTIALEKDSRVAVVPLGYADGVTRRLGAEGGEVLIGERRRPICGTVTMDQLIVDCGTDDVGVGEEVVLIGRQGDEEITADEWARRLGTIPYEVLCGIGGRVPRTIRTSIADDDSVNDADPLATKP
ncbi:MAG: alanine racemase [Acidimicrobiales bacterium]